MNALIRRTLETFFLFFLTLTPFHMKATIIETAHIADVVPLIDEKTWFLVDLDNTLFQATQALGHASWFYDEVQKRIDQGMTREEAIQDAYPEWIKTQEVCQVKPLEEMFISSLIDLQNRGITIMGFTHRQPLVAEATIKQVSSLGFDFSKTAPAQHEFSVEAKHPTIYKQGIFFVSDYNKKGDVFIPFLEKLGQKPERVVFIDDKRKNIEELEDLLEKEEIDYVGIHYTAISQVTVYHPESVKSPTDQSLH